MGEPAGPKPQLSARSLGVAKDGRRSGVAIPSGIQLEIYEDALQNPRAVRPDALIATFTVDDGLISPWVVTGHEAALVRSERAPARPAPRRLVDRQEDIGRAEGDRIRW
jgi:hypothetical protein